MKTVSKIAALALPVCTMLALAQPVRAADGNAASATVAAAAAASPAGAAPARRSQPKTYCLTVGQDTGTRLSKRMCRTKEEWAGQGIEVSVRK